MTVSPERSGSFSFWSRCGQLAESRPSLLGLVALILSLTAALGAVSERRDRFSGNRALEANDASIRETEQLRDEVSLQFGLRRPELLLFFACDRDPTATDVRAIRRAITELRATPVVSEAIWIDDIPSLNVFGLASRTLPADGISSEGFRQSMAKLIDHPLGRGQLVSLDGRGFLVSLQLNWLEATSDSAIYDDLLQVARTSLDRVPEHHVTVEATGDVPLYLDQISAHRRNESRFRWIGYSLVFLLAWAIYRSPLPVVLVAFAPALAIFWTVSAIQFLGEPRNPLSDSVLPILVAIVGVTDGVHLLAHFRDGLSRGLSPRQATGEAVRIVGPACLLTSLTTAIGFGSLITADSELVRGFGRTCGIGVFAAFVAVVTVLPWLASQQWVARRVGPAPHAVYGDGRQGPKWFEHVLNHPRRYSLIGFGITAISMVGLFELQPDEKRAYGLPTSSPSFQALARCDAAFGGIETAQAIIEWSDSMTDEKKVFEVVEEVDRTVLQEHRIGRPLSIVTLRRALTEAPQQSPFDFLALLPSAIRDAIIRPDLKRTVVSFRLQDLGVAELKPILAELKSQFAEIESRYPGFRLRLTGDSVLRGEKIALVIEDLMYSLVGAAVIIFVLMAVFFRNATWGWISIIPNLFPIGMSALALILMGRQLDVSAACALTVCLGIAVDDTIHYLNRYRQELILYPDRRVAHRRTLGAVGPSLVLTTVIMVVGFGTVLFSEMPAQRIFGAMAVCTIATALLGDLLFLPALLMLGRPEKIETSDRPTSSES